MSYLILLLLDLSVIAASVLVIVICAILSVGAIIMAADWLKERL